MLTNGIVVMFGMVTAEYGKDDVTVWCGGASDAMVCNEVSVTDDTVGVTVDDVDNGGLFGTVGCSDLIRGDGIVSGVCGDVSCGSWYVEYVEGRFQQA